jgi:hypothetical protein
MAANTSSAHLTPIFNPPPIHENAAATKLHIIYQQLSPNVYRVLQLLPGAFDDPIRCLFRLVALTPTAQQFPYEALSYVWGPAANLSVITVNAELFWIRRNLYEALRYLRYPEKTRLLWVDTICINQTDVLERSQQVMLQPRIYGGATGVLAWLGEPNDNSEVAFELVEKWARSSSIPKEALKSVYSIDFAKAEKAHQLLIAVGTDFKHGREYLERVKAAGHHEFSYIKARLEEYEAVKQTFHLSGERHWWMRRWVIQEVVYAYQLTFVCGRRELSHKAIADIAIGLAFELAGQERSKVTAALSSIWDLKTDKAFAPLGYGQCPGLPLECMLERFAMHHCIDRRDRIYALLSLSKYDKRSLAVDYRKTIEDVYEDATRSIIQHSGNLSCLGYNKSLIALGTPSWVRDWGSVPPSSTLFSAGDAYVAAHVHPYLPLYAASCNSVARVTFHSLEAHILNVRAYRFSTVTTATKILEKSDQNISAVLHSWLKHLTLGLYPTNENTFDAFWRTVQKDVHPSGTPTECRVHTYIKADRLKEEDMDKLRNRYTQWFNQPETPPDKPYSPPESESSSNLPIPPVSKNTEVGFGVEMHNLEGYCFITTMNSYMGIVHGQAAVGDQVFVLEGSPVPCILRAMPSPDPILRYQFVGVAYVHGIMDGQFMEQMQRRSELMMDLQIV